ncbi:hypothetical protein D9615_008608 [Tricholomella constricta]|uniref:Homeobox domain-containing protein n=1 Tax=Tricholomella constricta TaxID=117010 RepID=A0A8H5H4B9_9AGAR|nr:hypothetical protein D9615_008608 [Tricholomella constricta]
MVALSATATTHAHEYPHHQWFYPGSSSLFSATIFLPSPRPALSPRCFEAASKDSPPLLFLAYPFDCMSKSRSATPTPNTFSSNITPSTESTTSRTYSHEHTPSVPTLGGGESSYPSRPAHPHSLPSLSSETSHRASRPVQPTESSTDLTMAKRFRRESPQMLGGPTDKSSPSSDSQDDMADTEMDDRQVSQAEAPAPAVPPPKKKRTRTLTTPHQSAVLHALLAQSRFPTTAMREEVGRSIGLSARKVQIWFQNQRQKARRPRSQSETRKRFPQYGPFPGGPENTALGSFPLALDQRPSHRMGPAPHSASQSDGSGYPISSGYHSSESYSGSLESPPQLLGPGMPGSELQPDLPYRGRPVISSRPSTALDSCAASSSGYTDPRRRFMRSPSPPRLFPLPSSSRPTTTSRLHDRDFSRTLPPLIFNPTPGRSSFSAPGPHGMHPSASRSAFSPPYYIKRSTSPEATFAHHPPEAASALSLALPPPYTLQPRPQWDNSTFTASLRSSDSPSWTRHGSRSASGSITPPRQPPTDPSAPVPEASTIEREAGFVENVRPQRSGRYDPVRATFIYTTPSEPLHPSSPEAGHRSRRADDHEEVQGDRSPAHS